MPLAMPPPLAQLLDGVHWLRQGATRTGGEFAERLLFPLLMAPGDSMGPLPTLIRCSLPRGNLVPIEAMKRQVANYVRERGHPSPDWFGGLLGSFVAMLRMQQTRAPALARGFGAVAYHGRTDDDVALPGARTPVDRPGGVHVKPLHRAVLVRSAHAGGDHLEDGSNMRS